MSEISGSTALITDIDRRKALPIIRALGKEGVRVIGLASHKFPLGWFSRHCAKVFYCADYTQSPEQFLDELEEICASERPDVFYPIEDEVLALCVNNAHRWSQYTRALVPDEQVLDCAYDKWKTMQFARDAGVPIPQTWCPVSDEEIKDIPWESRTGMVVKPRKSSGSRGLRYVEKKEDLLPTYQAVSTEFSRPLVQERIPTEGDSVGIFLLLGADQEVLATFGHKRIREYPVSGGPSTLRESFRDDALIAQSISMLQKMKFVGVAMVEYKYDTFSSEYKLMEVNPRFWGSLQLAIHSGVNFPVLYHRLAMGMEVEPVLDFPENMFCRWLWPGDILHFLSNPNRFHLSPSFFEFRSPKLAYDIISRHDPMPMVGMILEAVRKLLKRKR